MLSSLAHWPLSLPSLEEETIKERKEEGGGERKGIDSFTLLDVALDISFDIRKKDDEQYTQRESNSFT